AHYSIVPARDRDLGALVVAQHAGLVDLDEQPVEVVAIGQQPDARAADHVRVAGHLAAGEHLPAGAVAGGRNRGRRHGRPLDRHQQHVSLTEHGQDPLPTTLASTRAPRYLKARSANIRTITPGSDTFSDPLAGTRLRRGQWSRTWRGVFPRDGVVSTVNPGQPG